jgi:ABC-type branched-subunit amino acid transport system ATPase component
VTVLLEARGVSKRFGGLTALNGVDFVLEEGRIASIIGPNGAGKTTFFNVFTGIYVPEEGTVTLRGTPLIGRRPDEITALGICRTFQNIRLFANMTAIENVLVGMHARAARAGAARSRGSGTGAPSSSTWSGSATRPMSSPRTCPTATSAASSWGARSPRRRGSFFSTNPPPA